VTELDHTFRAMGCAVRITVGGGAAGTAADLRAAERFIRAADAALSRFRDHSELCRLNADPRPRVGASTLLRTAVEAGVWAARSTGGLVDPTLTGALEAAGYPRSRDGMRPESLAAALAQAPRRRPARPAPGSRWRDISVDHRARMVIRPPGVRLDTGGTGKGLVADLAARGLGGHARFAVDCGGDVRIGGPDAIARPYPVDVLHPLTGAVVRTIPVAGGGIATSGLDVRLWRTPGGGFAHHLLDPSTGAPAWTGLIGVTALAATALEAETLAKAALLCGPAGGRRLLARHGGVLVHDDGAVECVGALPRVRPRLSVRLPAATISGARR
jgi:thiamine biosynthesis lipoprotein